MARLPLTATPFARPEGPEGPRCQRATSSPACSQDGVAVSPSPRLACTLHFGRVQALRSSAFTVGPPVRRGSLHCVRRTTDELPAVVVRALCSTIEGFWLVEGRSTCNQNAPRSDAITKDRRSFERPRVARQDVVGVRRFALARPVRQDLAGRAVAPVLLVVLSEHSRESGANRLSVESY